MRVLREFFWQLAALVRRRRLDGESKAELQFHLDMEAAAAKRRGLPAGEARREARLRAGTVQEALERVRDERGAGPFDGTLTDLRQAAVALRRSPSFALLAGGALAASVAVNTLIFTVVYGVVLRPLPYPEPERLVRVFESTQRQPRFPVSILQYEETRRENRTLDGIALYTRGDLQLMHDNRAERMTAVAITEDFLPVLGATPALGRNFTASEMKRGTRVLMLSHETWKTRFGADRGIIGRTVRVNRQPWTVVGVMPAGFEHVGGDYRSPAQGDTVALWYPLGLDLPEQARRYWHFTNAVARVKRGTPAAAAEGDLTRIVDDLASRYPDSYRGARARVEPLAEAVLGRSGATVWLVAAAGALVMLIACVNLMGLSIARTVARRRELSVRQALGGGAWRLMRVVLSENLLLGLAGGVLGLALAAAAFPLLRTVIPAEFPRLHEVRLTWVAALFALSCAMATSVAASVIPALRQTRVDPKEGMGETRAVTGGGRGAVRLRSALIAAEIALSSVLCFGAVLLVRSSQLLEERDHGFSPGGVLTFQLELTAPAYNSPESAARFAAELARGLQSLPKVKAAGLTTNVPWSGWDENTTFDLPGRGMTGESPEARFQAADAGTLAALGMRLRHGRWMEERDQANTTPVVVVNESLARSYYGGADAVGKVMQVWGKDRTIVGVVADIRDRPADAAAKAAFWYPLAQVPFGSLKAVIRTEGDPLALAAPARAAVAEIDRELPVAEVRSLDDMAAAASERRFALWVCEAFAALAMGLSAVGVYGILAYLVEQRRREIGLRIALGATRGHVLRVTALTGLRLGALGIAAGLVLGPAAAGMARGLLFGVSPWDGPTLLAAPVILLLFTVAGTLGPAWAASRLDPTETLRES
ncbi:MAG: ABC transporter permease [Bryobacteraceae bacterium]|nr:ABC transporter permease [Bryobacteraceae bacterium]